MLGRRLPGAVALLWIASCGSDDSDLFGGETDAAGGSAGQGGSAANAGAAGKSPDGAAGGDAASGGAGAAGAGGGLPDSGVDGSCTAIEWCRDVDVDGFGDPDSLTLACDAPEAGWVANDAATPCTDCFDQSAEVHPGSTQCIVKGYGPAQSFDANCDGQETECGPKAGQCGGVLCGQGDGYLPKGPSSLNPYCGSTAFRECGGTGTLCTTTEVDKPNDPMPCL
jgi:hypothetical protein